MEKQNTKAQFKPNNAIGISASLNTNFFKYWVEFLKPLHHLTEREIDIIAAFLKKRYELSKAISDDVLLDKVLMSEDSKREIREECNITLSHFQVIMGKLRKNGIFNDNRLNPKFIPNIKEESGTFMLLLYFQLS